MDPVSTLSTHLIDLTYLLAAVLFILGLKGLTHPRTAVRGNLLGAIAMLLAVVVTLLDKQVIRYEWIVAGLAVGTIIGVILAVMIQMTAMPQLVAMFNGFGGGASVLVAGAALFQAAGSTGGTGRPDVPFALASATSGIIGAVTFSGSLIAFAKLQGILRGKAIVYFGHQAIKALVLLICLVFGAWVLRDTQSTLPYTAMVAAALLLGILFVLPIGGADMPVVIALLNSYSGLAAASTGFVLQNNVLIIAGSLVGASGLILTRIMCKAMNRSLGNVIFGALGPGGETPVAEEVYEGKVKSTSAEEVAMLMDGARRVVIVPGYGMAVAQAQHAVRELAVILEARDIEVQFAIHPVAGRMPGHMNVLLAEANVPYDKLKEMDEINPGFRETDVALVIGANDVVNPEARTNPTSPIAGMPILNVDMARTVVVIKRSLAPGFAGIPNPLFAAENCLMLFGDGKKAVLEINSALKET